MGVEDGCVVFCNWGGVLFFFSFFFFDREASELGLFFFFFFFPKEFVLSFGRDREKSGKIGKTCNVYYSLSIE